MAEQEITTLSLERYAPDAKALIVATQALADASRHVEVTPLHLLSQCLSGDLGVQEVFRKAQQLFWYFNETEAAQTLFNAFVHEGFNVEWDGSQFTAVKVVFS